MNKPEIILFGEIMVRFSPPEYSKILQSNRLDVTFAGSEANTAVSLANFNEKVQYISAFANNDWGVRIKQELLKYEIGLDFSLTKNKRQGLIFIERGAMNRSSKVIYDRENSAFCNLKKGEIDWGAIFSNAKWFHWSGITPALSYELYDVLKEALLIARKHNVTISVDLNYRNNLWNYGNSTTEIMSDLVKLCDILIGNEEDAFKCLGIKSENQNKTRIDKDLYKNVCYEISNKFPNLKVICFTLRDSVNANHNKWSSILYSNKEAFNSREYDLTHIVDRVGAGDAFSAGVIYGLLKYGDNYQTAIEFATAASGLKHSISGDFNLIKIEDVLNIMNGNSTGRIER